MREEAREDFQSYAAARAPRLLRTAYALTGNQADAEDLLQTTLAKTYLNWEKIRDREAVDGYVRRIMVNTQTSWWRRRRPEHPSNHLPEQAQSDQAHERAERDEMWRELQKLPKKQRAVLVLRYYEDLSEKETADILGVSVGTVKSSTHKALEKLRHSGIAQENPRVIGATP